MEGSHFDYSDQVLQETIKLQQRQIDLLKQELDTQAVHIESVLAALDEVNKFDASVVESLKMTNENVYLLTHTVRDLIKELESVTTGISQKM